MQPDQQMNVIVDATSLDQMALEVLHNPSDVGKQWLAGMLLEDWPTLFRTEDDVNVEARE